MSGRPEFYAGVCGDLDVSAIDARVRIDDLTHRFDPLSISPDAADQLADLLKTAAQAARTQATRAQQRGR